MSNRTEAASSPSQPENETTTLSVGDLRRFLLAIARAYDNPRTGNVPIAQGLRALTKALKPYNARCAADLPTLLDRAAAKPATPRRPPKKRDRSSFPTICEDSTTNKSRQFFGTNGISNCN